MTKLRIGLLTAVVFTSCLSAREAAAQEAKPPRFHHGLVVQARKWNEADFTKDTRSYGVECYVDENANTLIYVSETGSIALAPVPAQPPDKSKGAKFSFGLVLKARRADEPDFTKDTKRFGIEAYKDENTNHILYISENGWIYVAAAPAQPLGEPKAAAFKYGVVVPVRRFDETDFTKDTKKFGIEAYKDDNTGYQIYISEMGALNVTTRAQQAPQPKEARFSHGLTLPVRKPTEKDFGKDTKKYGIEAFRDENTNNLMFISEMASVSTAPLSTMPIGAVKPPKFSHGLVLPSRRVDETDVGPDTKRYGVEAFRDENTGILVYISETGAVAVLPGK